MHDALRTLAGLAGIESCYWDISGNRHETNPDTMRRILAALDIPAESEREIAESLARLKQAAWRNVLPPVIVACDESPVEIPLRMTSRSPPVSRSWRWTIEREDGESVSDICDPLAMPVRDSEMVDGVAVALRHLVLPPQPLGYHRFRLEGAEGYETALIVAPAKAYLPQGNTAERYWGLTLQLYAVRSSRNWGIGDFTDLSALADWAGKAGASLIGVNPLHALFLQDPECASPYSPSSRLFLNPLYLDVTAIPDFTESESARDLVQSHAVAAAIASAKAQTHVGYSGIASTKNTVLEALFRNFQQRHRDDAYAQDFYAFCRRGGEPLFRHSLFQALSETFATHDWHSWPREYADPGAPRCAAFAHENADRIGYFEYLQWQSHNQLAAAAAQSRKRGMPIGLYMDLALGIAAGSADHWANPSLYMANLQLGAPPDPFNEAGQNWGVIAPNPVRMRETAYAPFIALLRANMRHAGALRIDHVMQWQRLFCVPAGAPASEGAYLNYPLDDLLAVAALESVRNACMVIGEDLGTVPDGFRERMHEANVLSSRIFYFERSDDRFRTPEELPVLAAVSASTHDLATLKGYWTGEDIAAKAALGIFTTKDEEQHARAARARDKMLLLCALANAALLPAGFDIAHGGQTPWSPVLADAIHTYLARSPCLIFTAQLDDLAGERQQVNMPGTSGEYPNWRRRLHRTLEDLAADPGLVEGLNSIRQARRKATR